MLRCLKWLPVACLFLFALCFGAGWIFGKPPEKVVPPVIPRQEIMSYVFSGFVYDLNGKPIAATIVTNDKKTGELTSILKQENPIGAKQYFTFRPDDKVHYKDDGFDVIWFNRTQFLAWLHNDFVAKLTKKGADMQKWQPILHQLEHAAGDTSCNYPVVLDRR